MSNMPVSNNGYNNSRGPLSYAQVVQQKRRVRFNEGVRVDQTKKVDPDWKGMRVTIDPVEWEWLNGCYVGKVRDVEIIENLQTLIHSDGITTVTVTPMGSDLVLLKALEGEDLMELVKEFEETFSNWFEYIKPWGEEDIAGYKFTGLSCAGISLHAWNDIFFSTLVSSFEIFVKADKVTKDRTRLDVARILVKTSSQEFINKVQRIMINDKIFGIRMMEERLVQTVDDEKQETMMNNMGEDQ
ncbi:hypothetical protein RIF29_28829 [Crotalaria pallida]|uniref:Uncharacterized protein n=1 Tax=Crotalaria pallida TaxID=3830 RepID=A0AAN9EIL5_CROPI